nr:hypothetical protein GCM10020063_007670 [Dactylosporangium thailandense]
MGSTAAQHELRLHDTDEAALPESYERDGVVLMRDVLSAEEVAEVRGNIARYAKWLLPALPEDWARREADGTLRGMYFLERVDPFFTDFAARTDLKDIVERVTGRTATFASMETFHKPARVGSPSLVHQDGVYYVGRPIVGVNLWLGLDDATADNGALKYWIGSHHDGLVEHGGVEGDEFFRAIPPHLVAAMPDPFVAELQSGSGALHHDMMVHGSDGNASERPRLAMALTYTLEPATR